MEGHGGFQTSFDSVKRYNSENDTNFLSVETLPLKYFNNDTDVIIPLTSASTRRRKCLEVHYGESLTESRHIQVSRRKAAALTYLSYSESVPLLYDESISSNAELLIPTVLVDYTRNYTKTEFSEGGLCLDGVGTAKTLCEIDGGIWIPHTETTANKPSTLDFSNQSKEICSAANATVRVLHKFSTLSTVMELDFFISIQEHLRALVAWPESEMSDFSTLYSGTAKTIHIELRDQNDEIMKNCIDTTSYEVLNGTTRFNRKKCIWSRTNGIQSQVYITLHNIIEAAGIENFDEQNNENFAQIFNVTENEKLINGGRVLEEKNLKYSHRFSGVNIILETRWENTKDCTGYRLFRAPFQCAFNPTIFPLRMVISARKNPFSFSALESIIDSNGVYTESVGVRINVAGQGQVYSDDDTKQLLFLLTYAFLVLAIAKYTLDCLIYLQCPQILKDKYPCYSWCKFYWSKRRARWQRLKFRSQYDILHPDEVGKDETVEEIQEINTFPREMKTTIKNSKLKNVEAWVENIRNQRNLLKQLFLEELEQSQEEKMKNKKYHTHIEAAEVLLRRGVSDENVDQFDCSPYSNLMRTAIIEVWNALNKDTEKKVKGDFQSQHNAVDSVKSNKNQRDEKSCENEPFTILAIKLFANHYLLQTVFGQYLHEPTGEEGMLGIEPYLLRPTGDAAIETFAFNVGESLKSYFKQQMPSKLKKKIRQWKTTRKRKSSPKQVKKKKGFTESVNVVVKEIVSEMCHRKNGEMDKLSFIEMVGKAELEYKTGVIVEDYDDDKSGQLLNDTNDVLEEKIIQKEEKEYNDRQSKLLFKRQKKMARRKSSYDEHLKFDFETQYT
eukprot:g6103.t1